MRPQIGVIGLRTGSIARMAVIGRLHHRCILAEGHSRAQAVEIQLPGLVRCSHMWRV